MTTDPSCEQILNRLDRIIELLEDRRKPATCGAVYKVTDLGKTVDYVECPQPKPCPVHCSPRGYSLAQEASDLIQQRENGLISEAALRNRMTKMTLIPEDE